MTIALMHYHLRPGGVTTVLRDQYRALAADHECLILSGELPAESDAGREAVLVIPEIGYAADHQADADPAHMAHKVRAAMETTWGRPADILHVHNPLLNKNPQLLPCLRILQEQGIRILVQVHDFAEEGRPSSAHARGESYPADCHYAVINSRDQEALVASGLRRDGVHLLFNAVRDLGEGAPPARENSVPRLLYPVRGIRRKNIGEALLLGVLLEAELSITLPPRNGADLGRYEDWRRFAESRGVRARFSVGISHPLRELIAGSNAAITTSVNEGFGFTFLEPWTAGLQVAGERVAHSCRDFEAAGMRFPLLYDSLPVETGLFDEPSLAARWTRALESAFDAFGVRPDSDRFATTWADLVGTGSLDFSFLDEEAQRQVITSVLSKSAARRRLVGGFPMLEMIHAALTQPDPGITAGNRTIVLSAYGPGSYAQRLGQVYRSVRDVPVRHAIDRAALLDLFLQPSHFRILESR